jgi:Secretion system C-terminal sorting domain
LATVNTPVGSGIQVYPNPAVNQLTITTSNWQNTTVNIVDVKGAIVKTVRLTAQQTAVDVTALPSGTYSVRSYNGNDVLKTVKITKQ